MLKSIVYYYVTRISAVSIALCMVLFLSGYNQFPENNTSSGALVKIKPLASKINSIKSSGKQFISKELFSINQNNQLQSTIDKYVTNSVMLKLNASERNRLLAAKDENIVFKIPVNPSEFMELELTRENVVTDDFKSGTLSGAGSVNYTDYTPGLYYRGIIKGDNESFASLSIFSDFVMAVASNKEGNWNLSSIKSESSMYSENYVFYNDVNMLSQNDFTCGVDDENPVFSKRYNGLKNDVSNSVNPPQLVRKYFECDYKMYQDYGSNVLNVNNYVTAFFNSCIAMYQQDSINTAIQQIFVWTSPDVYIPLTDNTGILKLLGGRLQNSFNGDLAHWVSTRTDISGGVAWVGVLCTPFEPSDSSGRYGVSVIDQNHLPFPQYSWVVNVIVHEMGHNLGSNHTHSCVWPGGPIDSCYAVEGGCYSGPLRPRIGTVMSYCHLNTSINLAWGFGPLPGDTIRANVLRASCLPIGIVKTGTEIPKNFMLAQNYPNPFNPTTNIMFSIPKSGNVKLIIYDLTGREITVLVNENLEANTYRVDFDAGNLSSGLYFYKLETEGYTETKKMMLIK